MKTILLSSVVSNALVLVFIALLWHQHRKRYSGLWFWLADYVFQMAGFLLLFLRGAVPDIVSIVIANALIISGIVIIYTGLERFVERPGRQIHNWLLVVISICMISYFTFLRSSIEIRTVIINVSIAVLTLQCAWVMLRRAEPSLRPVTRGVGFVFLVYSLVALTRTVHLLINPIAATALLFTMPAVQGAYILLFQMLNVALTFALIMMVTSRLARDIRAREQAYASLYDSMQEGMALNEIIFDPKGKAVDYRVLDVNPAYETILGLKREQVVGRKGSELYGEDWAQHLEPYARVAATRKPVLFEAYVPSAGKRFKVSAFSPEMGQFATIFEDITESKRAEQLILARLDLLEFAAANPLEELLRKALDEVGTLTDSPIGFYHLVDENQKGLTLQAWSTRTVKEFCKAEGAGMHYGIDDAGVWVDCVHQRKPVIHNDYAALPHKKGMPEGHAQVIRELVVPIMRSGRVVAILGVGNKPNDYTARDVNTVSYLADVAWEITARKRAEEAVKESEEKFRGVFETSRDFTFISTIDGKVLDNNEAARRFFGYSAAEIRKMNIRDFYANQDEREVFRDIVMKHGYVEGHELELKKKDGTIIDSEVTVVTRKDKDGKIIGFQGSVKDVTEKRKMERQLLQSEKLSTIGTMISGVAHEINNPLTSVIGNAQLLIRKEFPDEIGSKLKTILKESQRAAGIISGLLAFAREHKPQQQMVSINDVVTESLNLSKYSLRLGGAELRTSLSEDLPKTLADPFQLQQVFINLINNARDALEGREGAVLAVKTYRKDSSLHVEFEDNGPGIPDDVIGRIFDPFFTTKEIGKGTGLGLSMSYGIVEKHGGSISVESRPGRGATFAVTLPIVEGPRPATDKPEAPVVIAPGAATVLVVEDEPSLRELVADALTEAGCTAEIAPTGDEAIRLVESKRYNAVISDIKMPGFDGKKLYAYVRKNQPDIAGKIIFITGDVMSKDTQAFLKTVDNRFIEKPFNVDDLIVVLNEVLSG